MYSGWVVISLGGIIFLWLCILSYLVFKEEKFLKRLLPKDGGGVREKFNEIISSLEKVHKENQVINRNLREVSKEGLKHIQKIALVRYNPYEDTGGSLSFSLALLDGSGSGIILTSLHSRAGTRVYTKDIAQGKSELQLSKEEAKVLEKALET